MHNNEASLQANLSLAQIADQLQMVQGDCKLTALKALTQLVEAAAEKG
jgi:hypothetical protein